jgi:hypothetical protein
MALRKFPRSRRWAGLVASVAAGLVLGIAPSAQNLSKTPLEAATVAALVTPSVSVFHFTDGGDNFPGRMTTDASGNFYIAAQLTETLSASGFAVLKYRFDGTRQGVFRYKPAPGEFFGLARSVKVDRLGNIYVVGDTVLGGRLVSFTPMGSQRWAVLLGDRATALAVDALGNIYAAGTRVTGNFQSEWVIVKCTSGGRILWQRQHTGTARGDVRLSDIQVDRAGNPVVVGTTNMRLDVLGDTMTTMKLDPLGNTLWVKDFVAEPLRDQVASGLALDRSGGVYVTGVPGVADTSVSTPFTVKYDANGNRIFVLKGNGAGGSSVAVDPAGDVLLTGGSTASKFHPNGVRVWLANIAQGQKIMSDAAGNVYVAGSIANADFTIAGPSDYIITKLSPSGTRVFQFRSTRGDDVSDATLDPFGNLLVTGDALNAQFEHQIVTLRAR